MKEIVKTPVVEKYIKNLGANAILDGLSAEQIYVSDKPEDAILRQAHRASFAQGAMSVISHLIDLTK